MTWDDGLDQNSAAYRIAADDANRIRVLAGPGTGKSFAIKRRITRLLEGGVEPAKILAVSFTRMAASDLLRDIRSLEVAGAAHVQARTLHAECFRILNRNEVVELTGRHPRALSAFELEPLLEDLTNFAQGRGKLKRRKLINAYEAAWARLQTDTPGRAVSADDLAFEQALISWLVFHRAMLIGELIPFAFKYLSNNPACPERTMYDHVLVDEYQDLNRAEQEVAALLAVAGSLLIVGDDDQSIYEFKNAHPSGIVDFPEHHDGTQDHTMVECQRCPRLVVSLANSLIAANRRAGAPGRLLQPIAANGEGTVEVFQFPAHADEVAFSAAYIEHLVVECNTSPGQILVLCQSRKYARPMFEALADREVPTMFCYQESQLDEEGAAERMALLVLAGDREDRVALRYLVGCRSNTWLSSQWSKVRYVCEQENVTPWDALSSLADGTRQVPGCSRLTTRFRQIRDQIQTLRALHGIELLNQWLPDPIQFNELYGIAMSIVNTEPLCTARELAAEIVEQIEQPEVPDEVTQVRIMSLHKSKGLSANVVFIMGCVEGLIPRRPDKDLPQAVQEEAVRESRRLFFVGITRVKAAPQVGQPGRLILSSSRTVPLAIAAQSGIVGNRSVNEVITIASRFMSELGRDAPAAINPMAQ